ncbi:DUF3703 domain-containing protein [Aliiglaciecola sp. M165]|uniref:DUF3703 domain-containing protein n=1 Tax=Aliiglaciecola sp. M165 TaxID=2593649 RepID=UPI00117E2AA9|nr:DUF3703 domain-containing protein [Aliiglaciecola sp. M165]TRY32505.1 DUF3703 domain-containing protein [Aliiglaciecola sp. M165]
MNIRQAVKPYVVERLHMAKSAFLNDQSKEGFRHLENAHVLGQHSTYFHTRVHFEMLKYGFRQGDTNEVFGQILRIIGAITKTSLGLLPRGNTGGANVSAFKSMPISPENLAILDKIKHESK